MYWNPVTLSWSWNQSDMFSNNNQIGNGFQIMIGINRPNMYKETFPNTIIRPPWTWNCDIRQVGSMDSCCFNRNQDSSHQATFFQFLTVQFQWVCAHCSRSWLTELEADIVFCCCSPSTLWFDMLCFLIIWIYQSGHSPWSSLITIKLPNHFPLCFSRTIYDNHSSSSTIC